MKTTKNIAIAGLLTLMSLTLKAQLTLPYFTGFDNVTEQGGWIEYKKAATTFSHWGFSGFGAFSAPNCLSHSYSPSTGITLTDNWFVSPEFIIPNGGKLDSIRYKFTGFSSPVSGDTIAIYLLQGSQDPSVATAKLLLFDFRNVEYINDDTFRIKSNILLPPYNGSSHIAIRYRNTDCSSKWLSVLFDNIAISGSSVGRDEAKINTSQINVFPNPVIKNLFIETGFDKLQKLEIINIVGQSVLITYFLKNTKIDISDIPKGVYFIKLQSEGKTIVRKIVKE